MAKKKLSFFGKVTNAVTGKTAEERVADALQKRELQKLERTAYLEERKRQAPLVGQAKAKFVAKQQIKRITAPKPQGGGLFGGQAQKGFDPFTFGNNAGAFSSSATKNAKKVPSVSDIANMKFVDYSNPQGGAKAQVKKKLRKRKVKSKVKRRAKKKR